MLTLVTAGFAAPLVHTGDPVEAARLATERTSQSDWSPRAWDDLRTGGPVALGGSEVMAVCVGDGRDPADAIQSFRGAVLYADIDLAERFEAAQRAVACGGTGPAELARLAFLAGVAASDAGDEAGAGEWFRAARTFDGAFSFDTDFPSALAPIFEAAAPLETKFPLQVFPGGSWKVNGAAPGDVPAGWHVVQLENRGFWIRTGSFAETVVWPEALPVDLAVEDEAQRAFTTQLLSVKLGEGLPFGLVKDEVVWTGTTGRTDWKAHRAVLATPPPVKAETRAKRGPGPLILTAIGVGVAGVGGAMAAEAWHPEGVERYADAASHGRAKNRYWLGWGGVAGGAAVAGGGLIWMGTR